MLNLINSWKSRKRQWDKLNFEVRFFIPLFQLSIDISDRKFKISIIGFGIEIKKAKKGAVK